MAVTKQRLALIAAGVLIGWGTSSWVRWARQQLLQWLWPLGPLKLERPLVTFDIESTGLNVSRDRILEIAAVKVWPDGKVEVKGPQRLNPKTHIPAEVTAIHHITQADLEGCPIFADVAQEWRDFLEGCDLAGYNAKKFDVPILRNEFRRVGHFNFPPLGVPVVDAFRIFCSQEPRTLSAAVSFYCGRLHSKEAAHSALGDAWATVRVLVEQVRRYGELPRSTDQLAELCARPGREQDITPDSKFQWRGSQPVVAFGKHSGEPLAVLIARHRDHLMWMSGQDWGDESLILVAQALKGLLPTKEGGWQPLFDTPPPDNPSATATAGSGGGGSSSSRGGNARTAIDSNSRRGQQQQQQDEQMQQEQQAGGPEQQQGDGSLDDSTRLLPAAPAAAAAAAAAAATADADTSASKPEAPQRQRQRDVYRTPAPVPPAFTGWPELNPAAAPVPDSWAVEPSAVVADGWSLLETVAYGGNPGPQTPSAEPEVQWPGEGAEGGDRCWQQEQEQQQEGEGADGEGEDRYWRQQEGCGEEGGREGAEQQGSDWHDDDNEQQQHQSQQDDEQQLEQQEAALPEQQ